MEPIYLREQKNYRQKELVDLLKRGNGETDKSDVSDVIKNLRRCGVLKAVKESHESDNSDDESDSRDDEDMLCGFDKNNDGQTYKFTFVGLIVVNGHILVCYPKYLQRKNERENKPVEEMRQIMRVLERYRHFKGYDLPVFDDISEQTNNGNDLLDLYLFILNDYYESGLYSNAVEIIDSNGSGEIIWDKTINGTLALISNNRPIYPDLQTRRRIEDEYDYFKRLHKYVLTEISNELKTNGLLDLFGLTEVDFSDEDEDDFYDKDYVLYRLDCELNRQFNSRKQLLLKAMRAYIARDTRLSDSDSISSFGTTSFNLVWEEALRKVFDKKGDTAALKGEIDYPLWTITERFAKKTFIPDIVIKSDYVSANGKKAFIILDAKYYLPILKKGKAPSDQPGIEDIAKQYFYQLAFQKIIEEGDYSVENYFIFPAEGDKVIYGGDVRLDFLSKNGSKQGDKVSSTSGFNLELEDIKVRFLPAWKVFDCYCNDAKFDIEGIRLTDLFDEEKRAAQDYLSNQSTGV